MKNKSFSSRPLKKSATGGLLPPPKMPVRVALQITDKSTLLTEATEISNGKPY